MLYRPFGTTGKSISAISFGGMRFTEPQDLDTCGALLKYAHGKGINYFDTAPAYCDDRSEEIFGHGLSDLPRESFHISTKSGKAAGDELRRQLEKSLTRLQLDRVDFFYIWHLMSPEDWDKRRRGGAVEAALQARDEGLIDNLLCSSHMEGDDLSAVLAEGIFEGVLLGYNALNFPYRRKAIEQASDLQLGVVTMNPLAGGLIPQNPERFAFLKRDAGDDVVSAALRFNLSHSAITSALVGFAAEQEIDQAVAVTENFVPVPLDSQRLTPNIEAGFDALCTGCNYCLPCPVDIPIPKFMDVYNQVILNHGKTTSVAGRLRYHWELTAEPAGTCIACGACEDRCTQHLPIIERLKQLAP
ncbi:MAG: aldo/keto reductase [Desulfuromonas sp.]|nr:MAG: aldo/keto reductase [Desulfuromonas sp.]